MFNINDNVFSSIKMISIPDNVEIIFVNDMFAEDYAGGAEMTSQALIDACPFNIFKLKSKDVSMELLEQNYKKYWIFGNFANMNWGLIPTIVANLKYSIIEYDYKYCVARLPELHKEQTGAECHCENDNGGKLVSTFYYGAKSLFWMSEKQRDHYFKLFPFLEERNNMVLSSVFDDAFFAKIKILRETYKNYDKKEWLVFNSPSWVKGAYESEQYCIKNNLPYKKIWGLNYNETLEELAKAKGLVCLFNGKDTCPRAVIEIKLLGGEIITNENCQHTDELWWKEDLFGIESYLFLSRQRFWAQIKIDREFSPKISAYTTTRNCNYQHYPWKESIQSFLDICDEVIVEDSSDLNGGDETWEDLIEWSHKEPKLKIHHTERDYSSEDAGTFDGKQKALARSLCSVDAGFLCQFDVDELVREEDKNKWKNLFNNIPKNIDMLVLPVLELFGKEKLRVDVNPWKMRITRNLPWITHGIPASLRSFRENGTLYCNQKFASDGCCYIRFDNFAPVYQNVATFYTNEIEQIRQQSLGGNTEALTIYENIMKQIVNELPIIVHYSWISVYEKMRRYKVGEDGGYKWQNAWTSLYNLKTEDVPENNNFFPGKKWQDITDEKMKEKAKEIEEKLGGFIAHYPIDLNKKTPWINNFLNHSKEIQNWLNNL